ncbi:MAG: colicin immunity domain-containing protein [Cloacibacillus sp.]
MGKIVETAAGKQFKELCEKFIAGDLTAHVFARRFLELWDEKFDDISDWESETYLEDLALPVSLYDPDAGVYEAEKDNGLRNEDDLLSEVKKYFGEYQTAKAKNV